MAASETIYFGTGAGFMVFYCRVVRQLDLLDVLCLALIMSYVSAKDVKWFVTSLLRTCRPHTDELSKPCGKCDKYREFNDCDGASSSFP